MAESDKVARIIRKVHRRYYERYKNSVILINPTKKWKIIQSSNKMIKMKLYTKKLFTEKVYDDCYLTIIHVICNETKREISINVSFQYYKNGKKVMSKFFGKSILLNMNDILKLGNITHATLNDIVHKMLKKGKNAFTGLKKYPYDKL